MKQEKKTYPSFFLSIGPGNVACTYVDVQMRSKRTRSREWKLKRADW